MTTPPRRARAAPAPIAKVNLRKTHPTLYNAIMVLATARIALAFNFWFSRPTFMPYGIHKAWAGAAFFTLGAAQFVFLHVWRDLRAIRLVMALSATVFIVWGLMNTQQSFAGRASFQLPILYVAIAVLQTAVLVEPPLNPLTEKP